MGEKYSSITVKDILESFLCPIKVIYEGKVIYDDTGDFTVDGTRYYENKPVYYFKAEVTSFHHTIIEINY